MSKEVFYILSVLLSIVTSLSAEEVCAKKMFKISPQYCDTKPTEVPFRTLDSKYACSTECHKDVTCAGFFIKDDNGTCSLFSKRFRAMTYVKQTGTKAYGKSM